MWQADPGQHPHSSSLTSLSLTGRGQKIGRRKARKFELLWEGSRENSCVRCHQIRHLLSLVAVLRQSREMKVLGTLRKRLTGGGTPCCTLDKWTPPPRHKKQWIPCCLTTRQKERTLEMEGSGNGFVLGVAGKFPPDLPHLPLDNRCEALKSEDQGSENVDDGSSGMEELLRAEQPPTSQPPPLRRQDV